MDLNRQGASRRYPTSSGGANEGHYFADIPNYVDSGNRASTSTPGSIPHQTSGGSNFNNFYGNSGYSQPAEQNYSTHQSPQFAGGQAQQFNTFVPGNGFNSDTSSQFGNSGISSPFGGAQQQFLMAAGQQLFTNPMTKAAIDAYSNSLVDKSKTWIGGVKCYFAVDTSYVIKKLMLIFLPFLHKDWCIRYSSESVSPKDEPNLPDLYIPSMAFITYCLLSGYILGLQNRFAPEQLGIYASSALAWLLLEVTIIVIAKYVLNMSSLLGFFHLIAFGGYKFVCIVSILLLTLVGGTTGFMSSFIYTTLSLMYFLLRSLNANLQTTNTSNYSSNDSPRVGQYLVILICLFQPIVMYFLTYSLK